MLSSAWCDNLVEYFEMGSAQGNFWENVVSLAGSDMRTDYAGKLALKEWQG